MKKYILLFALGLIGQLMYSQKYYTRTGSTHFNSSVATFEPVEAINNSTTVILDSNSGKMAAQLFVNAFQFKVALMQEHFNENYMDSDQYPKASFTGQLDNFDTTVQATPKSYTLSGVLKIRGVAKNIATIAKIRREGDTLILRANFSVKPEEFKIKIPSIVRKKIAKEIKITLKYELVKKN
jgi:hypothetical protein